MSLKVAFAARAAKANRIRSSERSRRLCLGLSDGGSSRYASSYKATCRKENANRASCVLHSKGVPKGLKDVRPLRCDPHRVRCFLRRSADECPRLSRVFVTRNPARLAASSEASAFYFTFVIKVKKEITLVCSKRALRLSTDESLCGRKRGDAFH